MPMTAVGKIFRPALRQQISAAILQEHLEREHINATVETRFDNKKGMAATVVLQDPARQEETRALLSSYNIDITVSIAG